MWKIPGKAGGMSRKLRWMVFLWVGMLLISTDRSFGQAGGCGNLAELFDMQVVVPLDNLGIGRWEYRNLRKPYPLPKDLPPNRRPAGMTEDAFKTLQARCRAEAREVIEVIFDNRSPDRDFDVEFKFNLPYLTRTSFEDLENLEILVRRIETDRRRQADQMDSQLISDIRNALPRALVGQYPAIELGTGTEEDLAQELSEIRSYLTSLDEAQQQIAGDEESREELADLQERSDELAQLPQTGVIVQQREQIERDIAEAQKAREAIASAQREIAAAEDLLELRPRIDQALGADASQEAEWTLAYDTALTKLMGDGSGDPGRVADEAAAVGEGFRGICRQAVASLKDALEREKLPEGAEESRDLARALNDCYDAAESFFNSLGTDRSFRMSGLGSGILRLADLVEALEKRKPLRLREVCKKASADTLACTFKLFAPGNTPAQLPLGVTAALPVGLVEYQVRFRGEDGAPLYDKGYFATVPNPDEPANRFAWTLTGTVGYTREPDPDSTPNVLALDDMGKPVCTDLSDKKCDPVTPYSEENPYEGEQTSRYVGSGVLQLDASLGNRAKARVDLGFEGGDLGGAASDAQTKASQYHFEVSSLNGWGLKLGKFTLANPAQSIAVREAGEGFELSFRNLSAGYISKRESRANEADSRDEDSEVYILQARNLSTGNVPFLRGVSALLLFGQEEKPEAAYEYWTAGGEVFLAQPDSRLSGSLAYYQSERRPKDGPESGLKGDGKTGAVTAGVWWPGKTGAADHKLDFRAGFGSGDDPETPEDDGYLGETSSFFTGGTFFLGNVAGLTAGPDGKRLRPGLSNKMFIGAIYTDKTFSLLQGIAGLLKTGDQVVSKSTVIRLHKFLFDEKIYGERDAGWEASVGFTMEAPGGVTSSLEFFGFVPGDALETVLEDIPWAIRSSVTVKIF